MTIRTLAALATILLGVATAAAQQPTGAQTARGRRLESDFTQRLDALRTALQRAAPQPDARARARFVAAQDAEKAAEHALKSAQEALGKVSTARALVHHAEGKWIGGADRGIAAAEGRLAAATTAAEREAAQQELEKWRQNRADGVQALRERQAALEAAHREEPQLRAAVGAAEERLARAKADVQQALDDLGLTAFLSDERLDARLAEFVVLLDATPAGLARFAEQGRSAERLVRDLLNDEDLMLQMVVADGAKDGRYGEAMRIYTAIQAASRQARRGPLQRLAVAIALEHAVPIRQRNPEAAQGAPTHVDPVARYRHYEQAFTDGQLDPCFGVLDTWDYRMVVDGEEPDAILAWGREMLHSYRPDHVHTSDMRWRYVAAVRTDVRYGSQDVEHDDPELQFFQNILMNGGICGRRAFFGRFILRAFGVPTTARPQRGHAALVHWTPDGWVPCLGAGWGSGWTKTRYDRDLDFLATTQARVNRDTYMQVKRAQWIGDAQGEKRVFGARSGEPGFWYGVSLHRQRALIEAAGAVTLAAVGEELAEANESRVQYAIEAAEVTEADRQIVVDDGGVITIPAVACSEPRRSTGKILFLPSNLGGKQLHYARNGGAQAFAYTIEVPTAGSYRLIARVAAPSPGQHLMIGVNGATDPVDLALPHTVGLWRDTDPVEIELDAGRNVLRCTHRSDGYAKGFSLHHLRLVPID